jgi:hypothetical protein
MLRLKTLALLFLISTSLLGFAHAEEADADDDDELTPEDIYQKHRFFDRSNPHRQLYLDMKAAGGCYGCEEGAFYNSKQEVL